jgi:hypothetical protein
MMRAGRARAAEGWSISGRCLIHVVAYGGRGLFAQCPCAGARRIAAAFPSTGTSTQGLTVKRDAEPGRPQADLGEERARGQAARQ